MRVVVALGGNALLERGESPDAAVQQHRVRAAAHALAAIAAEHELVVCHGNGPQVGLLAVESENDPELTEPYPLDSLVAQTQGMIGYWLAQELAAAGVTRPVAAVITQVVVAADDPAFATPTKFVGATYTHARATRLAARHRWSVAADGAGWRRVVASPDPVRIVEIAVVEQLVRSGTVVICAGGGGVPVVEHADGTRHGAAAVIDKDLAAALLASELRADALLVLTDVPGVMRDFGTARAAIIDDATPADLRALPLPAGSMGPKVEACCRFVERSGGFAAIGRLGEAVALLERRAGTVVAGTGPSSLLPGGAAGEPRSMTPTIETTA